jgi:predicted nucleic acid-binding protein
METRRTTASLVVDASVTAAWCFEDEASPFAEAALDRVVQVGAHVPALWAFEMSNVLAMAERRGRVQADRAHQLLDGLLALPIIRDDRDPALSAPDLMRLARAHDLTAYDAAYLELAMRLGQILATRDTALQRAATRAGVSLFSA